MAAEAPTSARLVQVEHVLLDHPTVDAQLGWRQIGLKVTSVEILKSRHIKSITAVQETLQKRGRGGTLLTASFRDWGY